MLIGIGTKVRFIHTGDTGVVTALLEGDMVQVRLDHDAIEIPAFSEDLERLDDTTSRANVTGRFVKGRQEKKAETQPQPPAVFQYNILKSMGLQLAFEPVYKPDGFIASFKVMLINDTRYELLCHFELLTLDAVLLEVDEKLLPASVYSAGELPFDKLNESPVVDVTCRRITTEGPGDSLHRNFRIKPRQFFKNVITAPLIDRQVHHYVLFGDFNASPKETDAAEDLRDYTQRKVSKKPSPSAFSPVRKHKKPIGRNEVFEFAHFDTELDLHIERLTGNHAKMSNSDILRLQMMRFEDYMARAIRLGIPRVYVIHGVGKGKLRETIFASLENNPDVVAFKNEYHHKYGYGATEVVLVEEGE